LISGSRSRPRLWPAIPGDVVKRGLLELELVFPGQLAADALIRPCHQSAAEVAQVLEQGRSRGGEKKLEDQLLTDVPAAALDSWTSSKTELPETRLLVGTKESQRRRVDLSTFQRILVGDCKSSGRSQATGVAVRQGPRSCAKASFQRHLHSRQGRALIRGSRPLVVDRDQGSDRYCNDADGFELGQQPQEYPLTSNA